MADYSHPNWPHNIYQATAAQLEQDLAHAQGLSPSNLPPSLPSWPPSQQPTSQSQVIVDPNAWPQRAQSMNSVFVSSPNYPQSQPPPRSNSMNGSFGQYHQSPDASSSLHLSPQPPTSPFSQTMYNHPQQQHLRHPNPADQYSFGFPVAHSPYANSPATIHSGLPTSSPPMSPPSTANPGGHSDVARPNGGGPHAKRPRIADRPEDDIDAMDDSAPEPAETAKVKPLGACQRCKNLKVKCEFRTDTDPCKRCLNAGQDCFIPGRKKRRPPPKREVLLTQIREQAKQIEQLMAKLEATNGSGAPTVSRPGNLSLNRKPSSNLSIHSPILSPDSASFFSDSPLTETNKTVEDWVSKAKESLAEFGGFIGLGGGGVPKSYLVDKDLEDPSSDEDEYEEVADPLDQTSPQDSSTAAPGREEFDFAVLDSDGEESGWSRVEGRAKRRTKSRASSTHSEGRIRNGPSNLDKEMAILPSGAVPFGLMARLSLKNNPGSEEPVNQMAVQGDKGFGVASPQFFRPDADSRRLKSPQASHLPHILTRNVITIDEAEKLFKIYFDNMNLSTSLLDPVIYTAQRTCFRSPFLFTVICAIASRFYTERPNLYPEAIHYAQLAAGTSLLSGPKSIEMCQGYHLLSLYPVPARRWDEDRSWVFLGLAIRIAVDQNLHVPVTAQPRNANHAREMLNRTRTYLNLFNVDRSMGSQYGKQAVIPNSDYIANHSVDWWKSSECNMPNFDIHTCCYNAEVRVLAAFRAKIYSNPEHPTGLNKDIDFVSLCKETDDKLQNLKIEWMALIHQHTDLNDLQSSFRKGLLNLAFSYARLAVLSIGFQHAFDGQHAEDEAALLTRCVAAAKDVVNVLLEDIGRPQYHHFLRHGPDAQQVFITFAAAFLVKLLQPKFAMYFSFQERLEIRKLVKNVADLLGSPSIAVDDRHGPKLYSRFLKGLLATPTAKVDLEAHNLMVPKNGGLRHSSSPMINAAVIPNSTYSSPSPEAASFTPPPNQAATSFDQFASNAPLDPFVQPSMSLQVEQAYTTSALNNRTMNEFFSPPLPFDEEIISSMQSLTDPSVWQDNYLPGFAWMNGFQSNQQPRAAQSDVSY